MDQESTTTTAPAEGQEPEGAGGQEPSPESTPQAAAPAAEPKVFDEAYVKQLRKEAAASRSRLTAAEAELAQLKDRDKSETERLTERAAESEQRASAAEARLIRYQVAADRGLDLSLANAIAGETREEIESNADAIAQSLAQRQPKPPGFDGGARSTPEQVKPPEQAHNDFLLGILGRNPQGS